MNSDKVFVASGIIAVVAFIVCLVACIAGIWSDNWGYCLKVAVSAFIVFYPAKEVAIANEPK
jgi:hypothetical protein